MLSDILTVYKYFFAIANKNKNNNITTRERRIETTGSNNQK